MKKKLMLIDGNSILNRAFYGLSGRFVLSTKDGVQTNAIYGFLNIMDKYILEEKPEYIAIAFDMRAKTFRHYEYIDYKANRTGMPEELAAQLPIMKDVLDAMNIKRIEIEGFEADDILGTLAIEGEKDNLEVIIVTGDKDSLQLVNENIRVKLPSTRNGKTTTYDYTLKSVIEKYGVNPEKLIEVKGLMGDASDNIPGVKGIGEKTALKLIREYENIEGIYENIDNISGISISEKLKNDKDLAFLSRKLGTIKTDIKNVCSMDELKVTEFNKEKLLELFKKLEFKSLIKKYCLEGICEEENTEQEINITQNKVKGHQKDRLLENFSNDIKEILAFDKIILMPYLEKITYFETKLCYLSIYTGREIYHFNFMDSDFDINSFSLLLEDKNIKKCIFDSKSFVLYLKEKNIKLNGIDIDIAISDYVINPLEKHELENIIYRYINEEVESFEDVLGKGKKAARLSEISPDKVKELFTKRLVAIYKIKEIMIAEIKEKSLEKVFYEIEMPLIDVLVEMEYNGFKINIIELKKFSVLLKKKIIDVKEEIYELSGEEFNISSPKQLGNILFEKLGLPVNRKTKTGYSTDIAVLEQLFFKHEIIEKIIKFRQYTKLESTYVEGLMKVINPNTGKVHTSFSQTTAVTGRLSSIDPNLQNIPIKLELGREIRKVFITENENYFLTDADYSQIELRILAAITKDENLVLAFNNDEDIHTMTAMKVFDIPKEMVTSELRIKAKTVNFSIIYGIGEFSLSKDINVSVKEAGRIINEYLNKYPGISKYMKDIVEEAKTKGYVTTIFGRRRDIPELKSKNHNIREFGKRAAMNTPIQGSAADIIKIAMINVYKKLMERKLKSKLILQVHDELIIETHIDEKEIIPGLLKDIMENAVDIGVKLKADINTGNNWFETK